MLTERFFVFPYNSELRTEILNTQINSTDTIDAHFTDVWSLGADCFYHYTYSTIHKKPMHSGQGGELGCSNCQITTLLTEPRVEARQGNVSVEGRSGVWLLGLI